MITGAYELYYLLLATLALVDELLQHNTAPAGSSQGCPFEAAAVNRGKLIDQKEQARLE